MFYKSGTICIGIKKNGIRCSYKATTRNRYCKIHYKAEEDETLNKINFNQNGLNDTLLANMVGDNIYDIIKDYVKQLEENDIISDKCHGVYNSGSPCNYKRKGISLYCGHHYKQNPNIVEMDKEINLYYDHHYSLQSRLSQRFQQIRLYRQNETYKRLKRRWRGY